MNLSRKAKNISPSVTLAITAKANKMKNDGIDVVSFGAGEPDFNTPVNVQDAAIEAIRKGFTKYTPASGLVELKSAICNKLKSDNGLIYNTNEIVVSNGAKHSLANIFMAILNPGDEVIVPIPYWVSYPELIKLADGVPVYVKTREEDGFKYTKESLINSISKNTKAIVLNSPNNPTGTVYNREELMTIAEIAVENNLIVISDEIYEKLIYGNVNHISIASLGKDIKDRTIVVNGMSKAYAMTGWRIGYTACCEEIASIMSSIQSHATSNPNSIAQYASIEALDGKQDDIEVMRSEFQNRRDYMVKRINDIPNISCRKPDGAFYVMVNISKLIGMTIKGNIIKSSFDFCEALLEEEKVAAIPGTAFGADEYIRLSYATSFENIKKGLDRISNFVS